VLVEKDADGFTFRPLSESDVLDKQEYGATFVTPSVVRAIARGVGIEAVACIERDLWRVQDVYAAGSGDPLGGRAWSHTPIARGAIVHAEVDAARRGLVGGWVRVRAEDHPLREVRVTVGDGIDAPAELHPMQADLPLDQGGRAFRQTDWRLEGPVEGLPPGLHPLTVVAESASGRQSCVWARALRVP